MFSTFNSAKLAYLLRATCQKSVFSAKYSSIHGGLADLRVISQLGRRRRLDCTNVKRETSRPLITPPASFSSVNGKQSSVKGGLLEVHCISAMNPKRKMCSKHSQEKKNNEDEEEEERRQNKQFDRILNLALGANAILLIFFMSRRGDSVQDNTPGTFMITWSDFYKNMLVKGEVEKLVVSQRANRVFVYLHQGANIHNRLVTGPGPHFVFSTLNDKHLEEKLARAQTDLGIDPSHFIPVTYQNSFNTELFLTILSLFLISVLLFYFYRASSILSKTVNKRFQSMARPSSKAVVVEPGSANGVKFREVAGMEEAKQEVMEFIDYLKDPTRFTSLGAKIPKGALLVGPPGTGKTLLAKAVATEAEVPFFSMAGTDFVEIFGGVGPARVRDLFAQARGRSPCIVYVDEIDSIGKARSTNAMGGNLERENTLNQLLVEMDGMNTVEGVIVLASTNREDVLDNALLRPGRFDRRIEIVLPTLLERQEIFELYLNKLRLANPAFTYSKRLAELTPGKSGADISNICNEAALHAARLNEERVDSKNFDYAIERIIAGIEKKSHTMSPEERKLIAYHEAGHALVGWMLEHTEALLKVSIAPHTNSVFGYALHLPSHHYLWTLEKAMDRMSMSLGGRAAESVIFKKITTGSEDDLKKITRMARKLIIECGMNPRVGHISFPVPGDEEQWGRFYSNSLQQIMDEEVNRLIGKSWEKSTAIIREHESKLHELAKALLENEVLSYENIEKILGPSPWGDKRTLTKA